jgi:hypothetical protein
MDHRSTLPVIKKAMGFSMASKLKKAMGLAPMAFVFPIGTKRTPGACLCTKNKNSQKYRLSFA